MRIDFQLGRPAGEARIVVAMSGGVDSSVVAALAARSGAEVIGVTLQLYDHGEAVRRSRRLLRRPGHLRRQARSPTGSASPIMCSTMKAGSAKSVIERFADEYARGRTPIPCTRCNQGVKFTDLLELRARARRRLPRHRPLCPPGADRRDGAELHRAPIRRRDQSYFLFGTTRDQLDFLRFPARRPAQGRGAADCAASSRLSVAAKPDSQDICFVPDGDYAGLVKKLRPEAAAPGEIVDRDGRVLGAHRGVIHFTVGQRRGLEIGGQSEPLYVLRLEPEHARVVVGPAARARGRGNARRPSELAWRGAGRCRASRSARSRRRFAARFDGEMDPFRAAEYGVAPGQAAVLYDGTRLLGGGWIAETVSADAKRDGCRGRIARASFFSGSGRRA